MQKKINIGNFNTKKASKKQMVSKRRVIDHAEVFTNEREVNAMLNLVKHETERIDSRFFEPACGTGNFLAEILKRKLDVVRRRYFKNQLEYERYAILALSTIYGVEILQDNIQECRDRLLGVFTHYYLGNYKKKFKPELLKVAQFILKKNILWGNALSLRTPEENSEPIIFSEWTFVKGGMIKRRDYSMANLMENQPIEGLNLFSDLGDKAFIPIPIKDYPLIHFLKIE